MLAVKSGEITGGSASIVLEVAEPATAPDFVVANGTEWIGSGGTSYDLYIYTDNPENDPSNGNSGEQKTDPDPMSVTIDGDQTVEIDYTDMVEYIP